MKPTLFEAQLFVLLPYALSYTRLGQPGTTEELIAKGRGLAHLLPYITDMSLRTVWVHPDCVSVIGCALDSATAKKPVAKPRKPRQRSAKRFPGTLDASEMLAALNAL